MTKFMLAFQYPNAFLDFFLGKNKAKLSKQGAFFYVYTTQNRKH